MLLQILRTLEALAAHVTFVRLKGHMHSNVRCDVVSLDSGGAAGIPLAREAQIVGAFAAYMSVTNVFLQEDIVSKCYEMQREIAMIFLSSCPGWVDSHKAPLGWRIFGCSGSNDR